MIIIKTQLRLATAAIATALLSVSTAYAAGEEGGGLASLVPLILIMVIFYFLLIRPQQKRVKEHKKMAEGLSKGDKIVTGGGLIGKVTDIKDDIIKVEIAEGVKVSVQRDTIAGPAE
ncbi:MAG: preprotein translocase subunit YajC [Mariprofundaceae bacterium]